MDAWAMVAAERHGLAAELEALDAAGWAADTPCGGWTVREVVAHLQQMPGFGQAVLGMIRHRGDIDAFIDASARRLAAASANDALRQGLRNWAEVRRLPPGGSPGGPLVDVIVHGWDIRTAVGWSSPPRPPEHSRAALDFAVRSRSPFGGKKRACGLRWHASDIDWTWGHGPVVVGPAELLAAALAGRERSLDELSGDGLDHLRRRLPANQ